MTELLPCPFCGAPARDDLLPHAGGPGWVQCSECECDQHMSDTLEEAVARWNRRAPSLTPAQCALKADEAELLGNLPLRYNDGPDYCTVTDATGGAFALTVQPELMRLMERAALAAHTEGSTPPFRCAFCSESNPLASAHHCEACAHTAEELLAGVAEQSGAGAPETSVRCGAPAAPCSLPEGMRETAEDCSDQARNDRLFELDQPYEPDTADGWKPIATMPMDGTAFLAWVPGNRCIYSVVSRVGSPLSIFGGGFKDQLRYATLWRHHPAPPSHPSTNRGSAA